MTKLTQSYVHGASDRPLIGMTIGDLFDETVAKFPERDALVVRHQSLRYTYQSLKDEVDRCARGLMALGLQVGESEKLKCARSARPSLVCKMRPISSQRKRVQVVSCKSC